MINNTRAQGGVSLFIVIFTALIVTIITVSFTQLMINTQQQTLANDLAQRAYDSAMAGVEDAKRGLVKLTKTCADGGSDCTTNIAAANSKSCTTLGDPGLKVVNFSNNEVRVGNSGDNQAYTCVMIQLETPDYRDQIPAGSTTVIPLKAKNPYSKITLNWFTQKDAGASGSDSVMAPATAATTKLPPANGWGADSKVPPMMRALYVPGKSSISELDTEAQTGFLYPQPNALGSTTIDSGLLREIPVNCQQKFNGSTDGVCQLTWNSVSGGDNDGYLVLTSLYAKGPTSFTVKLSSGGTKINFDGAQPIIDSTGRADNLFRRVQARVKIANGTALPYLNAGVYVQNNLCKVFFVTDKKENYTPSTDICDASKNL